MGRREILVAREHDRFALRTAHRAGDVRRVRRGAYVATSDDARPDGTSTGYRERILAVHRQLRAEHVFSHGSAAFLWGLALWREPDRVHVVQEYRAGATAARDIARHHDRIGDVVELDGIPATDLTRTVVDCLTTMPPLTGLVLADSAQRRNVSAAALLETLERRRRPNGRARARTVLSLADGGAESPWESWLRYSALRLGLPRPRTQVLVRTRLGPFHVDVGWPEHGVLAEFDGRVKYDAGTGGRRDGAESALFDEKRREDAITEATGIRLLRFTARDAARPAETAERLLRRFPAEVRRAARVDPRLPAPDPGRR